MMKWLFVFALPTLLIFSSRSWACNNMKIFLTPANYSTGTAQVVSLTMRIQAETGSAGCNYFVTVDYGSAANFSSRALKLGSFTWPYQVAKDSAGLQILKALPAATSCADVFCDSYPMANGTNFRFHTYQFIIDSSNLWRKHGSYSENYTLRLYKGTLSSYTLVDQATMNVTFMAAKKIDISLVDTGSPFNENDSTQVMNFGPMSAGMQRAADLIVKYNAGCTMYISSQNNGSMKHLLQNQYVPYTLRLNGNVINLAGTSLNPSYLFYGSGVSPANGDVRPVSVTIGSVAGKPPGSYYDTVTFTVQSNE